MLKAHFTPRIISASWFPHQWFGQFLIILSVWFQWVVYASNHTHILFWNGPEQNCFFFFFSWFFFFLGGGVSWLQGVLFNLVTRALNLWTYLACVGRTATVMIYPLSWCYLNWKMCTTFYFWSFPWTILKGWKFILNIWTWKTFIILSSTVCGQEYYCLPCQALSFWMLCIPFLLN